MRDPMIDPRDWNTPPPPLPAEERRGVLWTIGTLLIVVCSAAQLYLMVEHWAWLRRPPSEGS